jgi:hypothetical protein
MAFRASVFAALAAHAIPAGAGPARLKGIAEAWPGMTLLTGVAAGPERDAALTPIGETGPGA